MRTLRRLLLIIFLTLFGLGIGLAIGAILMRRVDEAARKVTPENLADQAIKSASRFGDRLRAAFDEGSRAAAEKEAELRRQYDVPTAAEVVAQRRAGREAH